MKLFNLTFIQKQFLSFYGLVIVPFLFLLYVVKLHTGVDGSLYENVGEIVMIGLPFVVFFLYILYLRNSDEDELAIPLLMAFICSVLTYISEDYLFEKLQVLVGKDEGMLWLFAILIFFVPLVSFNQKQR